MKVDVLILGTGSLARSLCYSLPLLYSNELTVQVLGRNGNLATEVATIANARAAIVKSKVRFQSGVIDWDHQNNLNDHLYKSIPKIVFQASSLQSPWEFSNEKSNWTNLVSKVGFGFTLPFQAILAIKVASAIKELGSSSILVNACYPDVVNPLLKILNLPITCGVGNISILASAIYSNLSESQKAGEMRMIGHHVHVDEPKISTENLYLNPLVWLGSKKLNYHTDLLINIRNSVKGAESNQITGLSAAEVILALLGDKPKLTHVPGPNGLPGGYPVYVSNRKVKLSLPENITEADAILWNKHCCQLDGVVIDSNNNVNHVCFNTSMLSGNLTFDHDVFHQFAVNDIFNVIHKFINLRDKLRNNNIINKGH